MERKWRVFFHIMFLLVFLSVILNPLNFVGQLQQIGTTYNSVSESSRLSEVEFLRTEIEHDTILKGNESSISLRIYKQLKSTEGLVYFYDTGNELPSICSDDILISGFSASVHFEETDLTYDIKLSNIESDGSLFNPLRITIVDPSTANTFVAYNIAAIIVPAPAFLFVHIGVCLALGFIFFLFAAHSKTISKLLGEILFLAESAIFSWLIFSRLVYMAHYYQKSPDTLVLIFLIELVCFLYFSLISKLYLERNYYLYSIVCIAISFVLFSVQFAEYYKSLDNIDELVSYQSTIHITQTIDPEPSIFFVLSSYIKFSFRYYFEFPPDPFYTSVAIFQFLLGHIYSGLILANVINLLRKSFQREAVKTL